MHPPDLPPVSAKPPIVGQDLMSRDGKPGILNLRSEAYRGRQEEPALHDMRQCGIPINTTLGLLQMR